MNKQKRFLDSLTARQYGEVVLPDDSTGQGPGTLAEKLSRCKPARTERYVRAGRVWRAFCRHGTNFIECWCDRGTSFINGRGIVSVDKVGKKHWRSVAV